MPIKNPTLDALFPRGIRNFNPGNIQDGPFARSQPGYVGSDGRFAQFDTMDHGIDAQSSLLQGYGNKGLNTLNAIINRWAPSSDGNNTNAYASFVGKKIGVDPNQPLDMNDPNVRKNIAMAMDRFENGMSPVDPRIWQASGSPQQATAAPMQLPGATPEQPQSPQQPTAQSISLGDQENTQPFNNIGSTLANMGAAIASLDNRGTGIASLNASRVAGNLAAQEAAREKEGGWKYAGQTQNGQGLMFQNSRGEIRVEPLSPQFAGDKRTLSYKGIDTDDSGQRFDTFVDQNGEIVRKPTTMQDPSVKQRQPMDPDALALMTDGFLKGDPQVMTRMTAEDKKEIMGNAARELKKAGIENPSYDAILANKGKFAGILADERKRSIAEADYDRASSKFFGDAKTALEKSSLVDRSGPKAWNAVGQFLTDQSQEAGSPELASFRESTEALSRAYASALTSSGVTNQVAEEQARSLLSTIQSKKTYEDVVKTMTSTVQRSGKSMRELHANQRARNGGQKLPYPEYDEEKSMDQLLGISSDKKQQQNKPTGLPEVGKKTTINGVEIERLE